MRNVSLKHLLQRDQRAAAFYESLHPCVKRAVDSRMDEIDNVEDLSAVANNAMTQGLREFGGIYRRQRNLAGTRRKRAPAA